MSGRGGSGDCGRDVWVRWPERWGRGARRVGRRPVRSVASGVYSGATPVMRPWSNITRMGRFGGSRAVSNWAISASELGVYQTTAPLPERRSVYVRDRPAPAAPITNTSTSEPMVLHSTSWHAWAPNLATRGDGVDVRGEGTRSARRAWQTPCAPVLGAATGRPAGRTDTAARLGTSPLSCAPESRCATVAARAHAPRLESPPLVVDHGDPMAPRWTRVSDLAQARRGQGTVGRL
jgi:hypothetical protein